MLKLKTFHTCSVSIVGQISISLETFWYEPLDINSRSDRNAAEQILEFNVSAAEFCAKSYFYNLRPMLYLNNELLWVADAFLSGT